MTLEKKYIPSSVFTVRLGFGSVILAAVITLIGLAWIFFLGVMVGRMYYGGDSTKQVQTPPTIQQSAKQENSTPNIASTTVPVQSKTGTTYSPVVKEDTRLEKNNHAQDAFGATATIEQDAFEPLSLSQHVTAADNDENAIQNEMPVVQENSVSEANEQDADFIEKVEEKNAITQKEDTESDTESNTINTQDAVNEVAPETNFAEPFTPETDTIPDSNAQNTVGVSASDTGTPIVESAKDTIYIYTYQLGTFTIADNATALVEKLVDDGVNATVLREEKNGRMLRYVLVYHTGTESSQQLVQEKFVKHGLANFIIRRKTVQ